MNKNQYLNIEAVDGFVDWFTENLLSQEKFQHSYNDRRTKEPLSFSGLEDALNKYRWQGETLEENQINLDKLQYALRKAVDDNNDELVRNAAIEVMHWGGVNAHNSAWLESHTDGLTQYIASVVNVLNQDDITDVELAISNLRFNAGMTKLYSLLANNFIIYDSRVAAALGWLVIHYCQEKDLQNVPVSLRFPWASAKNSPNDINPKNRNPNLLFNNRNFPKIRYGAHYAKWNLKASWGLQAVIDKSGKNAFTTKENIPPLRCLEAALFMIGYDLGGDSGVQTDNVERAKPQKPKVKIDKNIEWIDCYTPRRKKKFFYSVDPEAFSFNTINTNGVAGPSFSLDLIRFVLLELESQFGYDIFPLDNNAVQGRNGTASPGLGSVYHQYNRSNRPDTSRLAAILLEFGVLIKEVGDGWRLDRQGVEWFWRKYGGYPLKG